MNMNSKIIISFFIGTAAGVGGSFYGFKKYFETKTAKEIKEMRDYAHECNKYAREMKKYADEMYELATGKEAPKEGFTKEEIVDYISSKELKLEKSGQNVQFVDKINRRKDENPIIDIEKEYNDLQDALADEEHNDYLDSLHDYTQYSRDASAYEHPTEEPGIARIELISALEYDNSRPMNSKIILSYYEGDDILCYEESDEVIINPEELIGEEALHAFGSPDYDDPDEIYVRNNMRSEDYTIIRHDISYREAVGEY